MVGIKDFEAKIKAAMVTDEKCLVGKTIKLFDWSYSGELIMGFEDKTFILFKIDVDRDGMRYHTINYDPKGVSPRIAQLVGVITEEETSLLVKLQMKSSRDSARAWRKRQYEMLKEEFEP